jgi:hypothetical protein
LAVHLGFKRTLAELNIDYIGQVTQCLLKDGVSVARNVRLGISQTVVPTTSLSHWPQ